MLAFDLNGQTEIINTEMFAKKKKKLKIQSYVDCLYLPCTIGDVLKKRCLGKLRSNLLWIVFIYYGKKLVEEKEIIRK